MTTSVAILILKTLAASDTICFVVISAVFLPTDFNINSAKSLPNALTTASDAGLKVPFKPVLDNCAIKICVPNITPPVLAPSIAEYLIALTRSSPFILQTA